MPDEPVGSPAPTETEEALAEALLDQLVQEQSPWEYIEEIVQQRIPPEHRQRFYPPFISLVAQRPRAEQDALIAAGQPVFRYRTQTARDEVAALAQAGTSITQIAPTVLTDDFLAEIVHRPGENPAIKYLVYHRDGTMEIADSVQAGGTMYHPPDVASLVETGALVLPTGLNDEDADTETAVVFHAVRDFIDRHVRLEPRDCDLSALYTLFTWIADRVPIAPYVSALGDFSAGKTTLLNVLGAVSHLGLFASGAITPAVIFRLLTLCRHGTLVIDESDFDPRSGAWPEILKILCTGSTRGTPVLRNEKNGSGAFKVTAFATFGPKILAGRRPFPDAALQSRCLPITMRAVDLPPNMPVLLDDEFHLEARALRNYLLSWRLAHYRTVTVNPRLRLDGVRPRANQLAIALLAVADDAPTRDLVVRLVRNLSEATEELRRESFEGRVAEALCAQWRRLRQPNWLPLRDVTAALQVEDDSVTAERVSAIVRGPLGLRTMRRAGASRVVVTRDDIEALARRYGLEVRMGLREESPS